jgi:hypothetical protein
MNPADIHARPLPGNVHAIVNEMADAVYDGKLNTQQAFNHIDQVAMSTWNWFPGILNRTREEFDRHLDRRIDAEMEGWE